jgi:hypothetical protein
MSSPARKMPMSSAMASAVSLLSPVIMITRTPAFVHSPMAAATYTRGSHPITHCVMHGWIREALLLTARSPCGKQLPVSCAASADQTAVRY